MPIHLLSYLYSGLVGSKLPKFSLFGDSMNTDSRMESTSTPGGGNNTYKCGDAEYWQHEEVVTAKRHIFNTHY